jgi:peptide/nickel transport system substrate-binding protein
MRKRLRAYTAVSAAAVMSLGLVACGGSSGGNKSSGPSTAYGDANTKIVNASTHAGGTLRFVSSQDFDSLDPGNMYYAQSWNFSRLYARPLITFSSAPGKASLQLQPDLATSLGQHSADLKTWTYHLKPGIKYSDGSPVVAADVKYAVARSNYAPDVINKGPVYFNQFLINPNGYKGPYKDKNLNDFKGVTTPDDHTVVFHLAAPFSEFDNLASLPQTAPVPQAADSGANGGVNYTQHVVSTGPYKMDNYSPGKSASFSKNPNWDPSTDPNRKQLVDKITFQANVNADTVDQDLLTGAADIDTPGTGVQAAARSKILTSSTLKKSSDDVLSGFLWYTAISAKVAPFTNINCRIAAEYATNKSAYQAAYGGPVGGDVANSLLPPYIAGHTNADTYPDGPNNTGDLTKAKAALAACGKPNGFSTTIAFRSDRPKEKAAAEAMQVALARVGIKLSLYGYPSSNIAATTGSPAWVAKNDAGLMVYGWGADFPTGFGFLQQITDPAALKQTGNSELSDLTDPALHQMFVQAAASADPAQRATLYTQADNEVMKQAGIIPMLYAKSLLYRPSNVTNVAFTYGYQMYDYAILGVTK